MKKLKITLLIATTFFGLSGFSQSKNDLKKEIEELKQQNAQLIQLLNNQQNNNQQGYQQTQYNQGQPVPYPQNGYPQSYQQQSAPQGYQPQYQQGYPEQANGNESISNLPYGIAIQRSRVEDAAMTATGSDIRGYGREQSAKSNFARNKAENQARQELSRQIEAYARYALNQYNEETSAGGQTGIDALDQENAITAAKNVIEGAKILDAQEYYDPNSRMYTWEICVVYDRAGLYAVMEEQSARIKANRAKFEQDMQKYFDEMDHMQGRMTEAERAQAIQQQLEQNAMDAENQRQMQLNQQRFDNNQQSVQQQQQYKLQYQNQQNQYKLQENQQNNQYHQQRQYNYQNYQYKNN